MNHDKSWVVMKFGGTSVGNPLYWPSILDSILDCRDAGHRPFVVCSALSGISNLLEQLLQTADAHEDIEPEVDQFRQRHLEFAEALGLDAEEMIERFCEKLLDRLHLDRVQRSAQVPAPIRAQVMSVGEMLSTQLGAEWLRGHGVAVEWKDARTMLHSRPPQKGASEAQTYLSATCECEFDEALRAELDADDETIVLTQGFIASNSEGRTVLLGRGGSDTAAACLAARIGASRLEIWTDVPGVFTANPQQVPQARLLYELGYDESETLAGLGAKVLHAPCIQPVREAGIPLHIRWTEDPAARGTVISAGHREADPCIRAVSSRDNLCLISMQRRAGWQPIGFMADVAACFKRQALSMDLLSSSPSMIQVTLDLSAGSGVADKLPELLDDLNNVCQTSIRREVASVSLVGNGMRGYLHRLGTTLESLRERKLLMVSQAGNDLTLSFVVPRNETDELLRSLHEDLFEQSQLDESFGPSWHMVVKDSAAEGCHESAAVKI